jgi:hypothetical protein
MGQRGELPYYSQGEVEVQAPFSHGCHGLGEATNFSVKFSVFLDCHILSHWTRESCFYWAFSVQICVSRFLTSLALRVGGVREKEKLGELNIMLLFWSLASPSLVCHLLSTLHSFCICFLFNTQCFQLYLVGRIWKGTDPSSWTQKSPVTLSLLWCVWRMMWLVNDTIPWHTHLENCE